MKHFFFLSIFIGFLAIRLNQFRRKAKRMLEFAQVIKTQGSLMLPPGIRNFELFQFYVGVFKEKRIFPFLHWGTGLEYFQNGAGLADNNKQVIKYLGLPIDLKVKPGPVYALAGV